MTENPEERFRRYFYGEFNLPPASPWACRDCGRGYAHRTEKGKCAMCKGVVRRVPHVAESEIGREAGEEGKT